jgi:lysophospholipase L1-like esterase
VPPPSEIQAAVADCNAAIARGLATPGAVLIDLHAVGVAAQADGTEASLVGTDGFHPSDAGHALVARSFPAAYAAARDAAQVPATPVKR